MLADWRVAALTPRIAPDERFLIVGYTQKTLDMIGSDRPIDRAHLARLIRHVSDGKPQAIGIDIFLDRPSVLPNDAALVAALSATTVPVVIAVDPSVPASELLQAILRDARSGLPAISVSGLDGVARGAPPQASLASSFQSAVISATRTQLPERWPRLTAFPRAPNGDLPFTVLNAEQALLADPTLFSGRIVLIGGLFEQEDVFRTPLRHAAPPHRALPGVLVLAYQIRTLLDPDEAPWRHMALSLLATAAAAASAAGAGLIGQNRTGFASLGFLTGFVVLAVLSFPLTGWLADLVAITMGGLGGAGGAVILQNRRAAAYSALLRAAFERHVPAAKDDALAFAGPSDGAQLARLEIGAVFTDLAGFSELVGRLSPPDLKRVLDAYLDTIARVAAACGGTIDQISGDGVHIFFGAPVPISDPQTQTLNFVLTLDRALEDFRHRHRDDRVGITRIAAHAGTAQFGVFGSQLRQVATAQGDTVNLTARLEDLARAEGWRVCVTGAVLTPAGRTSGWISKGRRTFRGIATEVEIFLPAPTVAH